MKTLVEINGQRWRVDSAQSSTGRTSWVYYADDYDGAPDSTDDRAGLANSYEEAIAEVEEICSTN